MVIIMKEKTVKKKGSLIFVILVCTILVSVFFLSALESNPYSYNVKTFSSYEELRDFLKTNFESNNLYGWSLDDSFLDTIPEDEEAETELWEDGWNTQPASIDTQNSRAYLH